MQIGKINIFNREVLKNRDFIFFILSIALLFPLIFFESRRGVVGDSLFSLLVSVILSFPFGLIPLGGFVIIAQTGFFEANLRAEIGTFILFAIMFLIGYFQWFFWLSYRPMFVKIRFWLVRCALVLAVLPLIIKGILFFRSV